MSDTSNTSKKAFDTAHTSVPVYYPDELSLVGGADHIEDPRRRGPLDTKKPTGPDPLYRPRRLERPFKLGFVESIDAGGVMQDISIILRNGVPTVEYGQMRTMGCRVVNFERKAKCGIPPGTSDRKAAERCLAADFPLYQIRCSGKKTKTDEIMMGRILGENNLRHDDDLETTIAQIRHYLDITENNFELTAMKLGVKHQTVRNLLKYDENASKETRAAVEAGRIGITAAGLLAREADHEKQNALLKTLIAAPDQSVRRAKQITNRNGGISASKLNGKRALVKFKNFVSQERDEEGFYDGMLALVDYMTTGTTEDERLKKLISKYEG